MKSMQTLQKSINIAKKVQTSWKITEIWNGAKELSRARKTVNIAALIAKIGVDTAQNEFQKGSKTRIML